MINQAQESSQDKQWKITAVICTKNEEVSVGAVISGCKSFVDEIIVIDGHSTDRTLDIAKDHGAVVYFDHGKGKGEAIRVGIEKAAGDIIVFIDADGSHDPQDIDRLVAPIKAGQADHVTGSRMRGGSDELHGDIGKFVRMVGSDVITLGINYRFNVRLTDSQNGFRAIRTDVARTLNLKENITTIEQEMIIKTLRSGYRITEIPAHEYARRGGVSKVNVPKVAWRYVYSWIKYLFF
jgi:dolichol-phosphate mannosyltransferase